MIVDFIIGVVVTLLRNLFGLIPTFTLSSSFTSGSWIPDIAAWFSFANNYFPLYDLVACLAILAAVKGALLLWDLFVWIYHQIPFKAT
jgi:hypothetical protein